MSLPTSVQVINIHGTRGMTIGHVNSTRVTRFVATKLLRNTGNISSTLTHDTTEVSASHQNVTQKQRHKVNVPPDPALLPTSDLPQLTPRHYTPPSHPTTHYLLIPAPTSRTLHPTITPFIQRQRIFCSFVFPKYSSPSQSIIHTGLNAAWALSSVNPQPWRFSNNRTNQLL